MKKYLIAFLLLLSAMPTHAANFGHRLGADVFKYLAENSLEVFKASIYGVGSDGPTMNNPSYAYSEFDVQETYDHKLAIFHDETLTRMLPYSGSNIEIYKGIIREIKIRTGKNYKYYKLTVNLLTLEQLKRLNLKGMLNSKVPSLSEVLQFAMDNKANKPMVLEIKRLSTDRAREDVLKLLRNYKSMYGERANLIFTKKYDFPSNFPITFLAFKKHFKKSFPSRASRNKFCKKIRAFGLGGVYQAGEHETDLCKRYGN